MYSMPKHPQLFMLQQSLTFLFIVALPTPVPSCTPPHSRPYNPTATVLWAWAGAPARRVASSRRSNGRCHNNACWSRREAAVSWAFCDGSADRWIQRELKPTKYFLIESWLVSMDVHSIFLFVYRAPRPFKSTYWRFILGGHFTSTYSDAST